MSDARKIDIEQVFAVILDAASETLTTLETGAQVAKTLLTITVEVMAILKRHDILIDTPEQQTPASRGMMTQEQKLAQIAAASLLQRAKKTT